MTVGSRPEGQEVQGHKSKTKVLQVCLIIFYSLWYLLITNKISEDLRRSYVLILSLWYYIFDTAENKLPKMSNEKMSEKNDMTAKKMSVKKLADEKPTDDDLEKFGIADERNLFQINHYVTCIT